MLLEVVESQVDHVKYLDPVVLGFSLHRAVDGFTIIDVNVILRNYELLATELVLSSATPADASYQRFAHEDNLDLGGWLTFLQSEGEAA